jgi:hypothetical protein
MAVHHPHRVMPKAGGRGNLTPVASIDILNARSADMTWSPVGRS